MKLRGQQAVLNLVYTGVLLLAFSSALYSLTLSSNLALTASSEPLFTFLVNFAPFIMLGSIAFYFVVNRNNESFLS